MASLRNHDRFVICVAIGCAEILKPALDFLLASSRDASASTGISIIDAAVILLV
ncbi:hypothetical protein ACUV84_021002 [Puccinellia chinampoensis]